MSTIKVYLTEWCPDCRRAKKFLNQNGIPFEVVDVDESPDAEDLVMSVNDGRRKVPTFEVDGRYFACSPFNAERLAQELNIPLKK
jgi:glutaredoxin